MPDAAAAAAAYIRALLAGSPPDGMPPEAFGEYRDLIEVIESASKAGGAPAAHEAWNGLMRRHPELAELLSGDPPMRDEWPTLAPEAVYGLAGDLVHAIEPYTEADPVALLLNILTAFGNVVGSGPHFRVEFTRHPLRLFVALVGETAKARKGQSWSTPRHVFASIAEDWANDRVTSGLSSGEGLIYNVRDPRIEKQPIKVKGRGVAYEDVTVDHGVEDKRLLIIEEELAQALKVMSRDGNILSPILRQAWDTGNLHPLTKHNPICATGAHISVVGHITREELLRHLDSTEQANGFANRFLWACVRCSKEIPTPTGTPPAVLNPLIVRLKAAIDIARTIGEMRRDKATEQLWAERYHELSEGKPGLLGAITARAEAQVMRLACLYAALDGTALVDEAHLTAGLGLWDYCDASARMIFGGRTGDSIADRIVEALRAQGKLSETDIYSGLFQRNVRADRIRQALAFLVKLKLVSEVTEETSGRSRTVWTLTQKTH